MYSRYSISTEASGLERCKPNNFYRLRVFKQFCNEMTKVALVENNSKQPTNPAANRQLSH